MGNIFRAITKTADKLENAIPGLKYTTPFRKKIQKAGDNYLDPGAGPGFVPHVTSDEEMEELRKQARASGYKKGGVMTKKFGTGGSTKRSGTGGESRAMGARARRQDEEYAKMPSNNPENVSPKKKFAKGGGVEVKGKTKGHCVKMARGGGVESKGKTKGRFV